jgi:hypothetical protein
MLRHLILDLLRRLWRVYAGTAAILAFFWAIADSLSFDSGFFPALSLAAIFVLGPMIAVTQFAAMEMLLLPVSRRDMWRATWFVVGVLSCGATLTAKLAGVTAGRVFTPEPSLGLTQTAISSLLDVAYAGVAVGALVALRPAWTSLPGRGVVRVLMVLPVVVFAGGALWGFLLQSYLPTEWWQMRGPAASLLVAGIGILAAAYFYVPPAGVRPARPGAQARARRPPALVFNWPSIGSLSGVHLLLVESVIAATSVFVLMILMLVGIETVTEPNALLMDVLRSLHFLPFESEAASVKLFPLAIFGAVAMNTANAMGPARNLCFRHLRAMPLTTRGLILLLLGRRALGWLAIWTILAVLHVITLRMLPETLRPELLAVCLGADALIYALQVRWQVGGMMLTLAMMTVLILSLGLVFVLPLGFLPSSTAAVLMFAFGLGAAIAAVRLSDRTLRSSSKLYAPAPRVAPAGLL